MKSILIIINWLLVFTAAAQQAAVKKHTAAIPFTKLAGTWMTKNKTGVQMGETWIKKAL
jgi:hypothetical protein